MPLDFLSNIHLVGISHWNAPISIDTNYLRIRWSTPMSHRNSYISILVQIQKPICMNLSTKAVELLHITVHSADSLRSAVTLSDSINIVSNCYEVCNRKSKKHNIGAEQFLHICTAMQMISAWLRLQRSMGFHKRWPHWSPF